MEEVLHYLELKNRYYEKFHSITAKFLAQTAQGNWDDLEFFVDNRERILNIIRSFDFKIANLFEAADVSGEDVELYRPRVKALLDARTQWADRIVQQDLELISRIDEMKSDTIRELKRSVETAQQLESFEEVAPSPAPRKAI